MAEAPTVTSAEPAANVRVHAIECGRLQGNRNALRTHAWRDVLRRPHPFEFPVFSFLIEHPEGLIAIDTGIGPPVRNPRVQRRIVPVIVSSQDERMGPRMRAAGFSPDDIGRVVLTHLDWDHAGGLAQFPGAEIMIHRPEHEFASKLAGRLRYQPHVWPPGLDPTLVDLQPKPFGPFPQSYPVTEAGDVQLVPLPGHSVAQVGVALLAGERTLLFAADHILRLDWFDEDCRAGWLRGLGAFFPGPAEESSRRLHAYASETTTVVLPSHDTETPDRLATLETWQPPPIGAKAS